MTIHQYGKWLPIESAPKDGTRFIAWDDVHHTPIYDMYVREGQLITECTRWSGKATKWTRPLPPPPTDNE